MSNSTSPSWPPADRLDRALADSHAKGRAALGLYLPLGYPTRTASLDALQLMAQSADVLEIGIPHHDPVMDGPVIREASTQALAGGFEMHDVFTATSELTVSTPAALRVMSYWAPIAQYGIEPFAHRLAAAGGAGVLIPALPPPAASSWRAAASASGHTIPLIPSHASTAQLAAIGASHSGMVYAPAPPASRAPNARSAPTCRGWSTACAPRPACRSRSASASASAHQARPHRPPRTRTPSWSARLSSGASGTSPTRPPPPPPRSPATSPPESAAPGAPQPNPSPHS